MIPGAARAAISTSEPDASMPLRTPFFTISSAKRSRPAPTSRPTMISQAQPIAMLMSSTYFSVCSVYEWVASAATPRRAVAESETMKASR